MNRRLPARSVDRDMLPFKLLMGVTAGGIGGIVTVLGEEADHVGHRLGSVVFKRSRFHRRGL